MHSNVQETDTLNDFYSGIEEDNDNNEDAKTSRPRRRKK